jgi:hypothetical protein
VPADGCRIAGGSLGEASAAAAAAAELWRDEPLLDVPVRALREQCGPRYGQLRLQAVEDGIEAQLQLGLHGRLTAQLRDLTAVHPLRERPHGQLMLTLYRSGRPAEALPPLSPSSRSCGA